MCIRDRYAEIQKEYFQKFHSEFPGSRLAFDVKKVQDIFEEEQRLVDEGGVKLNGKMILAKDRKALAYDLDSSIMAIAFREAVKKKNFSKAIDISEKMELDFSRSRAYGEVVHSLPEMCEKFHARLDLLQSEHDRSLKAFEAARLEVEPERFKIVEQERDIAKAKVAKIIMGQEEKGMKWKDVNVYSKESLSLIHISEPTRPY